MGDVMLGDTMGVVMLQDTWLACKEKRGRTCLLKCSGAQFYLVPGVIVVARLPCVRMNTTRQKEKKKLQRDGY